MLLNNNVRRSNHRNSITHRGVIDILKRSYLRVCNVIKVLCLVLTFFLIPVSLALLIYHVLFAFDTVRVLVFCVLMWVCIDSNSKL